ncbi:MAG: ABC transporter permease [Rhizobiales bacterium]|nr:ABC transporter permease [Hyphomicrobiales bacterium]
MRLLLEKRAERSPRMALLSPAIAIALTVATGAIIFASRGLNPLSALFIYFIEPLSSAWSIEQLILKATPLALIGAGLAVSYLANVWNIGAEGQFTAGAVLGGFIPVFFPQWQSPLTLFFMLMLGVLGGMAWASLPALLKNRFNANEILTSLMLVYVAQLILDWLVHGPWRDPQGYNFPKTLSFSGWQLLPRFKVIPDALGPIYINLGAILALAVALALAFLMVRTLKGFEIRVMGSSPRAGRFAGFSRAGAVWFCFLLSGGLAGLAGICEVMSTVGQLQPSISPGYGFTAIIVAFLGRLNPIGALVAALALAISYLGGEAAQVAIDGISDKIARVFQGILLFYILACDTLILYRIKFITGATGVASRA